MQTLGGVLAIVVGIAVVMAIVAVIKKPASVFKDKPEEQNPMQGKRVNFVVDESAEENADGMRGRLEVIGTTSRSPSFYERFVKRARYYSELRRLSDSVALISHFERVDFPRRPRSYSL